MWQISLRLKDPRNTPTRTEPSCFPSPGRATVEMKRVSVSLGIRKVRTGPLEGGAHDARHVKVDSIKDLYQRNFLL